MYEAYLSCVIYYISSIIHAQLLIQLTKHTANIQTQLVATIALPPAHTKHFVMLSPLSLSLSLFSLLSALLVRGAVHHGVNQLRIAQ